MIEESEEIYVDETTRETVTQTLSMSSDLVMNEKSISGRTTPKVSFLNKKGSKSQSTQEEDYDTKVPDTINKCSKKITKMMLKKTRPRTMRKAPGEPKKVIGPESYFSQMVRSVLVSSVNKNKLSSKFTCENKILESMEQEVELSCDEEKISEPLSHNVDSKSADFWLRELDLKKLQENTKNEHQMQQEKLDQMIDTDKTQTKPESKPTISEIDTCSIQADDSIKDHAGEFGKIHDRFFELLYSSEESECEQKKIETEAPQIDIEDKTPKDPKTQIPWELKNPRLESAVSEIQKKDDDGPSISKQALAAAEPIDIFHLIFDESMIEEIAAATNKYYYSRCMKADYTQKSHRKRWSDVRANDVKKFIGLLYYMGLVKKPTVRDHWATDPLTDTPVVRKVLTRDRYVQIRTNFRMLDEEKADYDDPLRKIRNFVDKVIENSRKHYIPSKNISLDESMIRFKGRHKFKVYMLRKPTKHGFKAYVVAESITGFALSWEMHSFTEENPFCLRKALARLLSPFADRGYTVYMDRYYTSPSLFTELSKFNIKACGTVLPGRLKLSESIQEEIRCIPPLGYKYFNYEGLTLAVWRDGMRHVYILSTFHDATIVNGLRRLRKKERKNVPRSVAVQNIVLPKLVVDYNVFMGGVDRLDQKMTYDSNTHSHMKWQNRIFFYFLDLIMVNAYVIYKTRQLKEKLPLLTPKNFRTEIIRKLFNVSVVAKTEKLNRKNEFMQKISGCYLVPIPEISLEGAECESCRLKGRQLKAKFMCGSCQTNLCIVDCYDIHRKMNQRILILKRRDNIPTEIRLKGKKKTRGRQLKWVEVSDKEQSDENNILDFGEPEYAKNACTRERSSSNLLPILKNPINFMRLFVEEKSKCKRLNTEEEEITFKQPNILEEDLERLYMEKEISCNDKDGHIGNSNNNDEEEEEDMELSFIEDDSHSEQSYVENNFEILGVESLEVEPK